MNVKYRSAKEEEFEKIYLAYARDIYKVCVYLIRDKDLAAKAAQETFVSFYDSFEKIEPQYCFAHLVNTAREFSKKYQKISEPVANGDDSCLGDWVTK